MQEIQLKFDAGKGSVSLSRITAVVGDRVGSMPKPTRRGYVFAGWYLSPSGDPDAADARKITAETVLESFFFERGLPTDTVLYARWRKPNAAAGDKQKNSLATQRRAVWAIAIAVVLLIAAVVVVNIVVDIYKFTDTDGVVYTIKKSDGEYALFHADGTMCDTGKDDNFFYYITKSGNQIEIDPDTGEYTIFAVVDVEGTEQITVSGTTQRVLMFKQLTYDASSTTDISRIIKSIEVHNQHGSYTIKRGDDGSNRFVVTDHDTAVLVDTLFAQLASACGHTISQLRLENPERLPDGSIDYKEYGLAPETRVELDEDGKEVVDENGTPVTYEYVPTRYTITAMDGVTYTVTVGDATVSGGGYYACYEGRDKVYTLSSMTIESALLQPIEALITPMVVYPMTMNTYFQVSDFVYRSDIDHSAITAELFRELIDFDIESIKPDEDGNLSDEDKARIEQAEKDYAAAVKAMSDEEFNDIYDAIYKKHSHIVTAFSYVDMAERENTLYSAQPYQMSSEYMAGYLPNSDNIGNVLQKLYSMTFLGVARLSPSEEELDEYGLVDYAHEISFTYTDAQGYDYDNYFVISAKNEDGTYYAFSPAYDMVVQLAESQADYLEWEAIDWYEREYFQANIAHVQSIKVEGAGIDAPILFELDNSKTDQSEGMASDNLEVYVNGQKVDYSLTVTKPSGSQKTETAVYNFRRFFQVMLSASMEGNAGLTNEEMQALREQPDSECYLKLTVCADDGQGGTMYNIYRFYRYSERKSYMTIETIDSPTAQGDPTKAQGTFYVLHSFCEKLITDVGRFMDRVEIVVDSKN